MQIKITEEKINALFDRKEVSGLISADVAPRREDVKQELAKKLKAEPETVVIKYIKGKFGVREFDLRALIYDSVDSKDKFEPKKKEKKKA